MSETQNEQLAERTYSTATDRAAGENWRAEPVENRMTDRELADAWLDDAGTPETSTNVDSNRSQYWTPEREADAAEHYRNAYRAANTAPGEVPAEVYARGWDAISAYQAGQADGS